MVGVPIYEDAAHLREALGSLLAQEHGAFAVVVSDDSGSDEPGALVRELAQGDARVTYVRNDARLGLAGNWRRAFALAREAYPEARYFAWGSDHDRWEPGWLAALQRALDERSSAVLAYPLNDTIDAGGRSVAAPWRFETRGGSRPVRFVRTLRRMVAGDMVYGLYRADALARCGALRDVALPDRLLLAELSLLGDFVQVPEVLWHRRRLRPPGRPPRGWALAHATSLARSGRPAAAAAYAVLAPALGAARRAYRAAARLYTRGR